MSTIAAISSPIGAGGIGIVRVSGNEALRIADAIFIFAHKKASQDASFVMPEGVKQQWTPLFMNYGTFDAGEFCDKGYAVYFPAKRAYTGEDTVEFYLHGGVRIMQGALDALLRNGAVMAKNGEFERQIVACRRRRRHRYDKCGIGGGSQGGVSSHAGRSFKENQCDSRCARNAYSHSRSDS